MLSHANNTNRYPLENYKIRRFVCPNCSRSYAYSHGLNQHMKFECGKEPKFVCTQCPYKSHQKGNFIRHCSTRHNIDARALGFT